MTIGGGNNRVDGPGRKAKAPPKPRGSGKWAMLNAFADYGAQHYSLIAQAVWYQLFATSDAGCEVTIGLAVLSRRMGKPKSYTGARRGINELLGLGRESNGKIYPSPKIIHRKVLGIKQRGNSKYLLMTIPSATCETWKGFPTATCETNQVPHVKVVKEKGEATLKGAAPSQK